MRNRILAAVLSIGLSACAVRTTVPETYIEAPETLTTALTSGAAFEREWWQQFDDPILDSLVAEALSANRDLQAAAARDRGTRAGRWHASWQVPRAWHTCHQAEPSPVRCGST